MLQQLLADGTWVLKHVGFFIWVTYVVLQSACVGEYIDCGNVHHMRNIKFCLCVCCEKTDVMSMTVFKCSVASSWGVIYVWYDAGYFSFAALIDCMLLSKVRHVCTEEYIHFSSFCILVLVTTTIVVIIILSYWDLSWPSFIQNKDPCYHFRVLSTFIFFHSGWNFKMCLKVARQSFCCLSFLSCFSCNYNHSLWHSFSLSKPEFTPMVLNVGFVVDKVTIIIPPVLHIHLCGIWGWKVGLLEAPVPKKCSGISPED